MILSLTRPQPFQGEPRGESPPARCPKPTRRNAGVATGHQRKCKDSFADGAARGVSFGCRIRPVAYNLVAMNDRIIINAAVLSGKPVIAGTRISVEFVVGLLAKGWSTEDVLAEYDHLKREDIVACLAYAHQLLADEKLYPVPV